MVAEVKQACHDVHTIHGEMLELNRCLKHTSCGETLRAVSISQLLIKLIDLVLPAACNPPIHRKHMHHRQLACALNKLFSR